MRLYGIWLNDKARWLRELPSNVDYGSLAILAFVSQAQARQRAAKHFCYRTYKEAVDSGSCQVRLITNKDYA